MATHHPVLSSDASWNIERGIKVQCLMLFMSIVGRLEVKLAFTYNRPSFGNKLSVLLTKNLYFTVKLPKSASIF